MLADLIENETKRWQQIEQEMFALGIEQGTIETAIRLLEMGFTVEQVAKGTRLSIDKVIEIQTDNFI